MELWMVGVNGGGSSETLRKLIGPFEGNPIGFDAAGSLFCSLATTASNVLLTRMDPSATHFEGQPQLASAKHVGSTMMADWSPDGQWLAYRTDLKGQRSNARSGGDWAIVLYAMETGRERVLHVSPAFLSDTKMCGPRWSPDGDALLVGGVSSETGNGLHTIDIDTGQVTLVKQEPDKHVRNATWSPDGKSIVYAVPDKGILRFELETGEITSLFERSLAFDLSPDGRWVAFWWERESLMVMPSTGGKPREIVRPEQSRSSTNITFVRWTPDGEYLLYSHGDQLRKVSVETGLHRQIGPVMPYLIDIAIHPDGIQMALTMEQVGSELWVMENFLPE
jgi:Tol biopolymer transport system component